MAAGGLPTRFVGEKADPAFVVLQCGPTSTSAMAKAVADPFRRAAEREGSVAPSSTVTDVVADWPATVAVTVSVPGILPTSTPAAAMGTSSPASVRACHRTPTPLTGTPALS